MKCTVIDIQTLKQVSRFMQRSGNNSVALADICVSQPMKMRPIRFIT